MHAEGVPATSANNHGEKNTVIINIKVCSHRFMGTSVTQTRSMEKASSVRAEFTEKMSPKVSY